MNFYQATYRACHVQGLSGPPNARLLLCPQQDQLAADEPGGESPAEFRAHHCSTCPILIARQADRLLVTVDPQGDGAGKVVLVLDDSRTLERLPDGSIFPSIEEAHGFLVNFYAAFSYDPDTRDVSILRIDRGDWNIRVLRPTDYYFGFISDGPFPYGAAQLDSIFYFRNTAYRWLHC